MRSTPCLDGEAERLRHGDGVIGRVVWQVRTIGAQHHAHERFFLAFVAQPAVDARRHRDHVALVEHRFEGLALVFQEQADGMAAQDEEGAYILKDGKFELEGFGVPSPEICSFALAAAIERRTGGGGAGKQTVPADIRDAATASLCEYLESVGVPAQGVEMYAKLAKAYYSRNVTASLTPEAIKLTASRIAAWFAQLDESEQATYSLFNQRLQEKAKEAAEPKVVEMGIL